VKELKLMVISIKATGRLINVMVLVNTAVQTIAMLVNIKMISVMDKAL
jgi:hypothetical protein